MLKDLGFALKVLAAFGSQKPSPHMAVETKVGGQWGVAHGEQYYWSIRFSNGSHLPVPILCGEWREVGPLQRGALRVARVLFPLVYGNAECSYRNHAQRVGADTRYNDHFSGLG